MTDASNPADWIEKARQDARVARRCLVDPPELGVAAYLVQQAVEKTANAVLVAEGLSYPRSGGQGHDVSSLAAMIPTSNPALAEIQSLTSITP